MLTEISPIPPGAAWPDPTPEMCDTPKFNPVWGTIKDWDISVPGDDEMSYEGATGNHVRAVLDGLSAAGFKVVPVE